MENINEIWKDVKGYEDLYQISSFGNVKSLSKQRSFTQPHIITKEKYLKAGISKTGYFFVILTKNSEHKSFLVHRLVAIAFIENLENKAYVNHIDCNKLNNSIDNLEWCSAKENIKHAMDHNLMDWSKCCKGEKHGISKLTYSDVAIIKSKLRGYSDTELSKQFNVSTATIYLIRTGVNWK